MIELQKEKNILSCCESPCKARNSDSQSELSELSWFLCVFVILHITYITFQTTRFKQLKRWRKTGEHNLD